jgi:hypothetical protein
LHDKLEIGDPIVTVDGSGIFIGMDMPDSNNPRFMIKLDRNKYHLKDGISCYFKKEILCNKN